MAHSFRISYSVINMPMNKSFIRKTTKKNIIKDHNLNLSFI